MRLPGAFAKYTERLHRGLIVPGSEGIMLTWIIAAGASAALIAVPPSVTQYDAVIAPDAAAPESFIGSAGVVHISLSDDALRYDVTIAGVKAHHQHRTGRLGSGR